MIYNRQQMLMKHIKKIHAISHYGKQQSLEIHHGQRHGEQGDLAGTWNVLQWRTPIWVRHLIFMVAV
jgi:hydrogenase/urease accessory protein HupE